jgi:hypothetical protein
MAFIDYWNAVNRQLMSLYGIDTWDAGIEPDMLAEAQEDGDSPKTFALWFGEKYGLTKLPGAA